MPNKLKRSALLNAHASLTARKAVGFDLVFRNCNSQKPRYIVTSYVYSLQCTGHRTHSTELGFVSLLAGLTCFTVYSLPTEHRSNTMTQQHSPLTQGTTHIYNLQSARTPAYDELNDRQGKAIPVMLDTRKVHPPSGDAHCLTLTDQRRPVSLKEGRMWNGDSNSNSYFMPLLSRTMLVRKVNALPR